jgi:hypothetical protein
MNCTYTNSVPTFFIHPHLMHSMGNLPIIFHFHFQIPSLPTCLI